MRVLQGGAFDLFHDETRGAEFGLQYRSGYRFWFMNPMFGINGSTVGNGYVYAGISFDIFIGNRLVFRPSFAPGLFLRQSGELELRLPLPDAAQAGGGAGR